MRREAERIAAAQKRNYEEAATSAGGDTDVLDAKEAAWASVFSSGQRAAAELRAVVQQQRHDIGVHHSPLRGGVHAMHLMRNPSAHPRVSQPCANPQPTLRLALRPVDRPTEICMQVLPCITHVLHLRSGTAAFAGEREAYIAHDS